MAFTNFYLIGGGTGSADINAGSTIGAAQVTTTNGSWTNATATFVAPSGTPFASTVAGDYASIYVDGATVAVYIAKVVTVVSSVSIIVSTTLIYGTAPTTSATARSCTINGSWNTEQVLAAGGLATFTVPQSTKINIKGNLTITASRTISMAGATTTPLWFSGYNTTPGDLDNDTTNALAKPVWSLNATFALTSSGQYQLWSGLSLTGNRSGTIWTIGAQSITLHRCRSDNTSSNAAAIALTTGSGATVVSYSWFKTPTTATTTGTISVTNTTICIGVVAEGSGIAGWNCGTQTLTLGNCVGLNNTGAAVLASTALVTVINLSVVSAGGTVDAVKWSGAPQRSSVVIASLFAGPSGGAAITNGVNNASGTNSANVYRACNDYYNATNPEVGFGDSPAFFPQTDSIFPMTSATNLTPVAGSNAINNGFPGIFENETFSSYPAIGAVQPLAAAGGSAVAIFGS